MAEQVVRLRIIAQFSDQASKKAVQMQDKLTKSAQGFKVEYLGLLFGAMAIQRATVGFLRSAITSYNEAFEKTSKFQKETNKLAAAFEFLKFRLVEALSNSEGFVKLIDLAVGIVDAISNMDDKTLTNIALALGAIAGLATLGLIVAQVQLLGSSLKLIFGGSAFLTIFLRRFLLIVGAVFLGVIVLKAFFEGLAGHELTWSEFWQKILNVIKNFAEVFGPIIKFVIDSITLMVRSLTLLGTLIGGAVGSVGRGLTGGGFGIDPGILANLKDQFINIGKGTFFERLLPDSTRRLDEFSTIAAESAEVTGNQLNPAFSILNQHLGTNKDFLGVINDEMPFFRDFTSETAEQQDNLSSSVESTNRGLSEQISLIQRLLSLSSQEGRGSKKGGRFGNVDSGGGSR